MFELVLRVRCVHGFAHPHGGYSSAPLEAGDRGLVAIDPLFECPGGRETVLDPAEVVVRSFEIGSEYVGTFFPGVQVQDVIDALTKEEE